MPNSLPALSARRIGLLHRNAPALTVTNLGQGRPRVWVPEAINRCPHLPQFEA